MRDFDEKTLTRALSKLSAKHRLVFAACCAERSKTWYKTFCQETNMGNQELFDEALAFVWNYVETNSYNAEILESYLESLFGLTPDEDVFFHDLTAYGEGAASALYHCVRIIWFKQARDASIAGRCIYNSLIDYAERCDFIQNRELTTPVGYEKEMLKAKEVQEELERQEQDLSDLSKTSIKQLPELVKLLKQRSFDNQLQPLPVM
jgi:uncharacterized protein YjaG (DUF416 family)